MGKKLVTKKQPPEQPVASASERRALLTTAAEAAQLRCWGDQPVTTTSVGGVELRVLQRKGAQPMWWVRTNGIAGAQVELSLRFAMGKDETQPPASLFPVVERLIALAREGGLSAGQVVAWPKPFGDLETELAAFALTVDPAFGELRTAHDVVPVLLAVGLTADEARLVREWSPQGLLEVLSKVDPLLRTTVERASLLASPRARQAIEQRVEREGSSMGVLRARTSTLSGKDPLTWTVDVDTADAMLSLLKGRVGHQRGFLVQADGLTVEVQPADAPAFTREGARATLKLTQTVARAVRATLKARPGTSRWDMLPSLVLEVVA